MKILSIDTSSDICGISLLEDNKLILQNDICTGKTHSENLMPQIDKTFTKTNLTINDIDLIVTNIGPGSFTGIRIGIAISKSFNDAKNITTIGISSLESLIYNSKNSGIIASIIPANNDDFYFAIYNTENKIHNNTTNIETNQNTYNKNILNILSEPKLLSFSNILEILKKYKENTITFIGTDLTLKKDKILSIIPDSIFLSDSENSLNSYSLGLAGLNNYLNGTISEALPLYLKKPQAQIELENKLNKNISKG